MRTKNVLKLICLFLAFFLLVPMGTAEEQGLKVTPRHFTGEMHTGDPKSFEVTLSGSTYQSIAMSLSSTEPIAAVLSISAGYETEPGTPTSRIFYPITDLTGISYGPSTVTTVFGLDLPVCPVIKIDIQNDGAGALVIDHLFVSTS